LRSRQRKLPSEPGQISSRALDHGGAHSGWRCLPFFPGVVVIRVLRSCFSASFDHRLTVSLSQGADAVPSKDYSRWPPCFARLWGEGDDQTEAEKAKKKTMTTNDNSTEKTGQAQSQSEMKQRTWNVILQGKIIGTIHGATEQQARDTMAPFKLTFKLTPATDYETN
jgi:hypothetical protein